MDRLSTSLSAEDPMADETDCGGCDESAPWGQSLGKSGEQFLAGILLSQTKSTPYHTVPSSLTK